MAAILDSIVPARRREKRRIQALEERLHARWGDPSITSPIPGGWADYVHEPKEVPIANDSAITASAGQAIVTGSQSDADRHLASLTLTIPLPWYSGKRNHRRSSSLTQESTPFPRHGAAVPRPISQDMDVSSAAVIYKPVSDEYRKELDSMAYSAHEGRSNSPAVLYKPVSEEYKKALDQMVQPAMRHHSSSSVPDFLISKSGLSEGKDDRECESGYEYIGNSTELPPDYTEEPEESIAEVSTASSPSLPRTESVSTATSPITDNLVKGMADFGLSPRLGWNQETSRRSSSSGPDSMAHRLGQRESTSTSSSRDSDKNSAHNPLGLQNATMSSGSAGGYYSSLEAEYRQIAKTVEEAAVAEYGRKLMQKSGQPVKRTGARARGGSLERPPGLAREFPNPPRSLSSDRQRDRSLDRIFELSNLEKSRATPLGFPGPAPPGPCHKDIDNNLCHYRERSLDRISESNSPRSPGHPLSAAVIPPPHNNNHNTNDRRRNMSADRATTGFQHRRPHSRTRVGDRVRGKSVESFRSARHERSASTDKVELQYSPPQELVPQAEELWG